MFHLSGPASFLANNNGKSVKCGRPFPILMHGNVHSDLMNFRTKNISTLEPKFERKKGYCYNELDHGRTLREQIFFLNEYQKKSWLSEKDAVAVLQCPHCSSDQLCVSFQCQLCSSSNISRGTAIQHDYCGNIDLDHKYVSPDGSLLCRKCKKALNAIGVDYLRLGSYYKCGKCGALLPTISHHYQCFECGKASTQEELKIIRLPIYSVNHEILKETLDRGSNLGATVTELKKLGINAIPYGSINGLSKIKHTFPLLIFDNKELPLLVVEIIESNNNDNNYDELNLLSFIARCNDAKIINKVLVVKPSLDENLRHLAEINGVVVIESKTDDPVLSGLVDIIKQAVHKALEIA